MSLDINLRTASPADLPFLLRLRKLTMTEHLLRVGEPVDDETHRLRALSNFETARIICEGAQSIGLLKWRSTDSEWYVQQIQLLPEYQSRGIGERVLRELLADAAREGVPVSLSVLRGNPARRLYERLGFEAVAETEIDAKLVWRA